MATKEKKLSINRKQNTNSTAPKEVVTVEKQTPLMENQPKPTTTNKTPTTKPSIARKLAPKPSARKLLKKPSFAIKLKNSKAKNKIQCKLTKTILQVAKGLDSQSKLLKNGVKEVKPRKKRTPKIKLETDAEPNPDGSTDTEKKLQPKKRLTKKALLKQNDGEIKIENDDNLSVASDITDTSNSSSVKPRKPRVKKIKIETDNIDEVMNDLSFLIKNSECKKEEVDSLSESSKSDSVKVKRPTKKQKLEQLNKLIKKENIESTLNQLNSDQKIIDLLDLNVTKIKKESPIKRRRHSIEKFQITGLDGDTHLSSIFNHLPRSLSPRSKRGARVRQSVEGSGRGRRSSPYTTRSDSPARLLRNGKHRKLKDLGLLDGLDPEIKRRRRLCSDLSGSEISVSKLSGYESDSSYSDLASLHGAENPDIKDTDTVMKLTGQDEDKSEVFISTNLKRSPSSEAINNEAIDSHNIVDTNSNVYNPANSLDINLNDKKSDIKLEIKTEEDVSPSVKVPEKAKLLDIMKMTFNQIGEDSDRKKIVLESTECYKPIIAANVEGQSEKEEDEICEFEESYPETVEEGTQANEEDFDVLPETESMETQTDLNESEEVTSVLENGNVIAEDQEPVLSDHEDILMEHDTVVQETNSVNSDNNELVEVNENTEINEEKPLEGEEHHHTDEAIEEEKLESYSDSSISSSSKNPILESNLQCVEESPEELALKENILQALGLQSLKAAEEAKQKCKEKTVPRTDSYTGTLKTVIKINRDKKKGRNSLKMTLQKNKNKSGETEVSGTDDGYKIMKENAQSSWKQGNQSSDTAGAHRKSHYSNRSNMDGSSEHTSDGEMGSQDGAAKLLVIPEKASSFSIHPGRLCKDECSYCFGKFGLFDTPCHIAQIKSVDRQNKILATEKHLTRDSCLCDACYRHVDRKSNTPSYTNKSLKRNSLVAPGPRQNHCHVLGCSKVSSNVLRRKWIIKMKKSICQVINIDLDNPGLHSIPICDEHYAALEHLMVCAMCKRRLARNHIHYLGPEANDLNSALQVEGIPITLTDKPVVCKLCKCFATVILKNAEDRPENSVNFFIEYKKRLLHFNDIVPMDSAAAEEPIIVPSKEKALEKPEKEPVKKKKKLTKSNSTNDSLPVPVENSTASNPPSPVNNDCQESEILDQNDVPSTDANNQSRPESPGEYSIDYTTLIPAIAMDCGSDTESKKESSPKKQQALLKPTVTARLESVKEAVEISKNLKVRNDKSEIAVQRLGSNPSISVRQLFPGEEDLALQANIEFGCVKDKTPEGWEKCSSVIQYDMETKRLWNDLQKPYGNQSSFLRHLILLEKYFRNGDLILSPSASHHSQNYSESVNNRLKAYDNIPTNNGPQIAITKAQKSNSGIITSSVVKNDAITITSTPVLKSTPITLNYLKSPPLIPTTSVLQTNNLKSKTLGSPPGLISLHPGTNRPIAPLSKVPQSQKIKFPITKNWRPNLIPIDPTKKQERKSGLVQVISGGKPYHITLEDYKKMCAIKRSFEMRQKKLQEVNNQKILVTHNAVLKSIVPRKGLIISKTAGTNATATLTSPKNDTALDHTDGESILDKLDKQVERLDAKINNEKAPSALPLPKIPKSLTVIPQTVARKSTRPTSPVLLITPKNSSNKS